MVPRRALRWLVLSLLVGSCSPPPPTDRLVVGVALGPNSLDPRLAADEASQRVHQLVFAGLVRIDDHLRVVPDLASDITMPDPQTYRIRLRSHVRFHDGRPLTAADVVFTYHSVLDPATLSPHRGALRGVKSVHALAVDLVEFTLVEPFGSFPANLVIGIVPTGATDVSNHPIGAGPYRFERHLPDDRIELARFDDYFGGAALNPGIVLRVVPDDTMRGLELQRGTLDVVVNDLPPDIVHRFDRERRLRITTTPGVDYAYIGINLRDPALADVRVRQALSHAIDKDAIVQHLRRGFARPAVGLLPAGSWAFASDVVDYREDLARAMQLLDEAGFPDPDGPGPQPRLSVTLKTSTAEFARLQASVIQEQARRVGIDIRVRSQEFATLYADVLGGNFQLYTLQWVGISDPDILRRVFHSDQRPPAGFNRGYFSDEVVDRLIDEASSAPDERERRRLYADVQRRIATLVPYVSLWHKTNVVVSQANVSAIPLSATADFHALKHVRKSPAPLE